MDRYTTETTNAASLVATDGTLRRRLGAGWHFTRHLGEMLVAMFAGMGLLSLAVGALGEPPGYSNPLVEYGLMGAAMALPMVGWMRFRGHTWADGAEMSAAMIAPMLALALPSALGIGGPSGHSLMMLAHVAMIAGMVALMLVRRDRYAHGAHHRHA